MLDAEAAPAAESLAGHLETDTSPHVGVVLAEVLARLGRAEHAVPFLTDTLDHHPNAGVRLQELNALTHLGSAARPALPAITSAAFSSDEYLRNAGRHLLLVLNDVYRPGFPAYFPF
ncbi:hypothetical protein EDD29_4248 [Actinocorallia herbida]|uniref:Tetratricopeptide repeat protein n=1 Tax=Actinocorallia herbida TaxID=58109 RepID=A0A3N1CZG5_9ACTN|nr:hypothetical protein [Actinocorallia herbida]ROO86671.1 hypothetical protein EDD29_4248 [Actinocorallia herbida]